MRRRVINILFSVLSVSLALGLFFFSVFAITSTTSISNIFSFQVSDDDLHVEITGVVENYESDIAVSDYYHDPMYTSQENFVRWNLPDLYFVYANGGIQDIIFTFTIKNHEQNRSIRIYFTNYISNPVSTKILNTPSEINGIIIEPIIQNETGYIAREGIIRMHVSIIDDSESFYKINNNFVLNIEALS